MLLRRKPDPKLKTSAVRERLQTEENSKSITDSIKEGPKKTLYTPLDTKLMVSTGSTLLDLAISGGRVRGGGIPGGIMVEISGPPASGKTAIAIEIATGIQNRGGQADIADPEKRLDEQYTKVYGLDFDKANYSVPNTVSEVFKDLHDWKPENKKVLNAKIVDSIAALSTEKELSVEGDKRGQVKAKELHSGCRKTARLIDESKLIVFTNHEMDGEYGKTNPGGKAVPFYSSLRIRISQKKRIEPEKKMASGVTVKKSIGILSEALVKKSSVDDEYRTAPIYLIFGQGIDDVRANLQWYKTMTGGTKYNCVDKEYARMDAAIRYIEQNNLEGDLREMVIDLWEEIEAKFKIDRKKKVRF